MIQSAKDEISGVIENVVYYNKESDYAVVEISDSESRLITAVGTMPIPFEGECVVLRGYWGYHKEFGKQFVIESFDKTLPAETEGILQYLSSHTVKGIGPVTARKIVERFGENTFDVIENHPEWLADVPGITMKKAAKICESFKEQNGLRGVVMFCKDYMGITEATRVYKKLGAGAVGIIQQNPYILCEKEYGIGFVKADELAMTIGFSKDNDFRIQSGIKHILGYNAITNGHTCLPVGKLVAAAAETLGLDEALVSSKLDDYISYGVFFTYTSQDTEYVMTEEVYSAEDYIAKRLLKLDRGAVGFDRSNIDAMVAKLELEGGIRYAEQQKKAIYTALECGVMVLTGGPGTGKTTVVKGLLSIFKSLSMKTVLCAPTGRAAKRMSEATSSEAKTIHRMLEMERSADLTMRFGRGIFNPLEEYVVIVDEASMIDLLLMEALLKAMRRGARLILIGDADQLPSVGAGNVLLDIISSERIKTVYLDEIFRQSKESLIVTNAHNINRGQMPILNATDADFFFVRRDYERDIPATVADLVMNRLPRRYGAGIREQIQIITPSKKGAGGIEMLNTELQSKINPPAPSKAEKAAHGTVFREGDKVMQTANNYDIEWERGRECGVGIFNGDIGVIESINNRESEMIIRFDDRVATYSYDNLDELESAYAITVHKSQGSEYPVVIIPMYSCAPMLMTRNLLYTAVTRAKSMVILVGRADIVQKMLENKREIMRYTTLSERLVDYS